MFGCPVALEEEELELLDDAYELQTREQDKKVGGPKIWLNFILRFLMIC